MGVSLQFWSGDAAVLSAPGPDVPFSALLVDLALASAAAEEEDLDDLDATAGGRAEI